MSDDLAVLNAARCWWLDYMPGPGERAPGSPTDAEVLEAYAKRGQAGMDGKPCCDLHGRNCEPPSELCCQECTEARHAGWRDGRGTMRFGHPRGEMCSNPDLSPVRLPQE